MIEIKKGSEPKELLEYRKQNFLLMQTCLQM